MAATLTGAVTTKEGATQRGNETLQTNLAQKKNVLHVFQLLSENRGGDPV